MPGRSCAIGGANSGDSAELQADYRQDGFRERFDRTSMIGVVIAADSLSNGS
jgi:hypothetical protein